MTDESPQLEEILNIIGKGIKKLHEEYDEVHKLECEMLDKKVKLNKRIGMFKRKLDNPELWKQAYNKVLPGRKYDI